MNLTSTNVILRIIGLVAAFVILTLAGVLPPIAFILAFLGAFTEHYISDLEGDAFFTDEPLLTAALRHAGYGITVVLGVLGAVFHFPIWAMVVSFIVGLGVHLWGDILSVKEQLMASGIGGFLQDIVLYPFLGWVGMKIADGAVAGMHNGPAKWFAYVGLAVAETGLIAAYRIYRDGNDPAQFNPDPAPAKQ